MGKRLALIIGNSVYQDQTLARLKSPDVDVGALRDILEDSQLGGFDDVDLLFNSTSSNVRMAISGFFSGKSRDDLLVLYFSGHGVLDENGRLYLAVKDTKHNLLRATAITAGFVAEEMDNSRSQRQVLILDCCHSGAFARGAKGSPGSTVGTATAFGGTGSGRVVLTASDATQYAWEGDRIIGEAEGSLFTHFLVKGLQTGQADFNKDGQITVDELFDYVYDEVLKRSPNQTPSKWSSKEQGEIVLARAAGMDAYSQFSINLQPPKVRAGQTARLTVKNQGGIQGTFSLTLDDRNEELDFNPPTAQLRVPEGQSSAIEFRAQPRHGRIIGRERSYPFAATVSLSQGETQTQRGEVIAGALLPLWTFSLPIVIVFCLASMAVAGYWIYKRGVDATATPTLTVTSTTTADTEAVPQSVAANQTAAGQIATTTAPAATDTPNPTSGHTPTYTPTPTASNVPTPTSTYAHTSTFAPAPTASDAPTPTASDAPTATYTYTPTPVQIDVSVSMDAFVPGRLVSPEVAEQMTGQPIWKLLVGHFEDSSLGEISYNAFLYFDLTSIPSGSEIIGATLRLSMQNSSIQPPPDQEVIPLCLVQDEWVDSEITWENQPNFMGDCVISEVERVDPNYYEWNVTSMIRQWIINGWSNYYGLVLVGDLTSKDFGTRTFVSQDWAFGDLSLVPLLRITYQEP